MGKESKQGKIISSKHFLNISQMNFQQTDDFIEKHKVVYIFVLFKINILLFSYSCPSFPPLLSSAEPYLCSHSESPPCCPCPWVIYTCSLTSPFLFFPPLFSSPSPLVPVCLFLVSMPLVQFCSFIVLFISFLLQVRSNGICLSLPG